MSKYKLFYISLSVILLAVSGCSSDQSSPEEADQANTENASPAASTITDEEETDESEQPENTSVHSETDSSGSTSSETSVNEEESTEKDSEDTTASDPLSAYSSEQIEYARIWLQLGPNQDIDTLNVEKIPSGTALNPNDEHSATYPHDVVQLSGTRLVDGSITYKSNGNGTITVYDVPLRWETNVPELEVKDGVSVYTQDLIDSAHDVSVDVGDPEAVEALINIEDIH